MISGDVHTVDKQDVDVFGRQVKVSDNLRNRHPLGHVELFFLKTLKLQNSIQFN